MNRREFLFSGTAGVVAAASPSAAATRKVRVAVIGLGGRAVGAADAIRCSAPLWLDEARFELSTFLLPDEHLYSNQRLYCSHGEVPMKFLRGWNDLSWVEEDLVRTDLAYLLVDLWAEARDRVAGEVTSALRRLVEDTTTIALYPWKVWDGRLVAEASEVILQAQRRVVLASAAVNIVQGNGAAEDKLALAAFLEGRGVPLQPVARDVHSQRVQWAEIDALALPVIRVLACGWRTHLTPSALFHGRNTSLREVREQLARAGH